MKHLKISCQKHKIDSLLLSSRYMTNNMKSCSFLHAHFIEQIIVVKNLFLKKLVVKNLLIEKNICCRYTLGLPHRGNSNVYLQHMLQNSYLHFPSIMSIVFTPFKYPKLPIIIKIPVSLRQTFYICMTAISPNSSS